MKLAKWIGSPPLLLLLLLALNGPVRAQATPEGLKAKDTPNDGGSSITLEWKPAPATTRYIVERAEGAGSSTPWMC